MSDLVILPLIWVAYLVLPLLALWRFVRLSRRVFRGVQFPRSVLTGTGLALGLAGYALFAVALAGFWGLVVAMAATALFSPPDAPSVLLPVSFAEIPFLLAWFVSEPLIYFGCRAKRADAAVAV